MTWRALRGGVDAVLLLAVVAFMLTGCLTRSRAPEPRATREPRGALRAGVGHAAAEAAVVRLGGEAGRLESSAWSAPMAPASPRPPPPAPPLGAPAAPSAPGLRAPAARPPAPLRPPLQPPPPLSAPAIQALRPLLLPTTLWVGLAVLVLMPATAEAPEQRVERVLEQAEALKEKFLELEEEVEERRVQGGLEELERNRPVVESPPPGVSVDDLLWREYTEYYHERLEELAGRKTPAKKGRRPKPPLAWEEYWRTQQTFRKGQQFEWAFSQALWEDCERPPEARQIAPGMERPLPVRNMGLEHEADGSLTYADQVLVDEASIGPGLQPWVETFSNKSRDFRGLNNKQIRDQAVADRN